MTSQLSGDEQFSKIMATVRDFWAFALSDLRANTARGYLAEFIVAKAVEATHTRVEWDAYDVYAPDGTTIEVKTSGYSQSWPTNGPPVIQFGGLPGSGNKRSWDAKTNTYGPAVVADVYVFAVHTTHQESPYDVLDISAWQFQVLPGSIIGGTRQKSMRLSTVERLGGVPVEWRQLAAEIRRAAELNAAESRVAVAD